jgi:hypothetical protein
MPRLTSLRVSSFSFALLAACGGSPPATPIDAASPTDAALRDDAAVAEAPDASTPDAWVMLGALGDPCYPSQPCGPGLLCDGSMTRTPICTLPARTVDGLAAYVDFPNLAVTIDAPLASSDIASVEFVPLDAEDQPIGEPFTTAYATEGPEARAIARFYVRCLAGAMITASITLIDAAGARSEPMLVTPIEAVRVDAGQLCDDLGRTCWTGPCAEAADGEMRCP